MRPHAGALARICRAAFSAIAMAALIAVPWPGRDAARAHEGHDHGDKPAAGAGALASPRVVAVSESYQFVGIVEGEVLVIYLDRADDNAPGHGGHHRGLARRRGRSRPSRRRRPAPTR